MRSVSKKIWNILRSDAQAQIDADALLSGYLQCMVLKRDSLDDALAHMLSEKLSTFCVPTTVLRDIFDPALTAAPEIGDAAAADLEAISSRDPAALGMIEPFLHYKGFHALEAFRLSHWLWLQGRKPLALFLHHRIAEVFSVDIHPAARIGKGIFIDHATGVVIGETAVVGDNVSLLHEVTLGGTGKERGDRHPKVGNGVLIGAGAKILGNVRIGDGAKIGAGSVVLDHVPAHTTAAGVPARIVGHPRSESPALSMDQSIDIEAQIDQSYFGSML